MAAGSIFCGTRENVTRFAGQLIGASVLSLRSRRIVYLPCAKSQIPLRGSVAWMAKLSFHQDGPRLKFIPI